MIQEFDNLLELITINVLQVDPVSVGKTLVLLTLSGLSLLQYLHDPRDNIIFFYLSGWERLFFFKHLWQLLDVVDKSLIKRWLVIWMDKCLLWGIFADFIEKLQYLDLFLGLAIVA